MKFWQLIVGRDTHYFTTIENVVQSIAITYSAWAVKPTIEIKRDEYIAWRVADGKLIEAFLIIPKDQPDHL